MISFDVTLPPLVSCSFGRLLLSVLMDPSHILFWNVRWLNSIARQNTVRSLIDSMRVDVVCIQETKMVNCYRRDVLSMLGSNFDNNFVVLPSDGASGGILVAWRGEAWCSFFLQN